MDAKRTCLLSRLLILPFLAPGLLSAATNTWTSLGPDGGHVFQVAFHPTDAATLYAVTYGGLYRTSDTGNSWQLIKGDFPYTPFGVATSPGAPDLVLIAAKNSVYLSTDRGTQLTSNNSVFAVFGLNVRMSRDAKTAYYSTGVKVYRSTDGGTTWRDGPAMPGADPDQLISGLDIDPADSKVVFASIFGRGIFRSSDGGDTWQLLAGGPADISRILGFTVDPTNGQRIFAATETGLYVSVDGGASWGATPVVAGYLTDIDVDPANPNVLYATDLDGELKKSVDGGQQWTPLVATAGAFALPKLIIAPGRSSSLALIGGDGVMISEDAGAHWSKRNTGLRTSAALSLTPGTGRTYAAVRASGLYSVANGASVVTPLNNDALLALDPREPFNLRFAVLPGQSDTVLATLNVTTMARSVDGGANWAKLPFPAPNPDYIVSSPQEPQTLYASAQGGIYRSADGGDQWVSRSVGLPTGQQLIALVPGTRAGAMYAVYLKQPANTSTIYRTTDAGLSWAQVGTEWNDYVSTLAVHPQNEQVLYVSTGRNVQRSTDGGATWNALKDAAGNNALCCSLSQISFDPMNPKIIYAVSTTGISRSVDGGEKWQPLDGLTNGVQQMSLAFDAQPSTLLVGTNGQGIRQITIAPDIEVGLTNPSSVAANVAASWGATVRNLGPYDATNVRVAVQLPTGTTGISASGNGATCSVATTTVTCSYEVLRTGSPTSTLTLNATPAANGTFTLSASATADQPDAVTANNSATSAVTVPTSPPASGGSGGGGGGAISLDLLGMLGALTLLRARRGRAAKPVSLHRSVGSGPGGSSWSCNPE